MVNKPCVNCVYFKKCGNTNRYVTDFSRGGLSKCFTIILVMLEMQ